MLLPSACGTAGPQEGADPAAHRRGRAPAVRRAWFREGDRGRGRAGGRGRRGHAVQLIPDEGRPFYSGLEPFGARLVDAVFDRPAGQPALVPCARRCSGEAVSSVGSRRATLLHSSKRVPPRGSSRRAPPCTREQQVLAEIAADLAAVLAPDPGDDDGFVARALANALMGVHSTLVEYVRHRLLTDDHPERSSSTCSGSEGTPSTCSSTASRTSPHPGVTPRRRISRPPRRRGTSGTCPRASSPSAPRARPAPPPG